MYTVERRGEGQVSHSLLLYTFGDRTTSPREIPLPVDIIEPPIAAFHLLQPGTGEPLQGGGSQLFGDPDVRGGPSGDTNVRKGPSGDPDVRGGPLGP